MTEPHTDKRRGFLKHLVGATGSLPLVQALSVAGVAAVSAQAVAATPTAPVATPQVGYLCFGQDEAAFVEALVNVMCPADAYTPSGVDCGLAVFMDRQLAGAFGRGAKRYMQGPWLAGKPQHGNQLPLTPEQFFKAGIEAANQACVERLGKSFDRLAQPQADAFLLELAAGKLGAGRVPLASWFNELVYPLFRQACFADPIYDGNVGKVFWKLLGYPGLPATHGVNMVRYRGLPFPGAQDPKSIADFS